MTILHRAFGRVLDLAILRNPVLTYAVERIVEAQFGLIPVSGVAASPPHRRSA